MALENMLALLALFGRRSGAMPMPAAAPSSAPMPGPMPSAGPVPGATVPPDPTVQPAAAAAAAASAPGVVPAAVVPAASPIATAMPTLPWPSGPVPATLPPFPGPGWEPDLPVTSEIASRATYWNGMLWNFATRTQRKPFVQENLGGEWVTFAPAWHPGDKGPQTFMATEAWRVKHAGAAPVVVPAAAAAPPMVVTRMPAPGPGVAPQPHIPLVGPYPGPGAWHTNAAYILRLQTALNGIGFPLVLDGKDGPKTQAAVKAFQAAHNLTQDGQAGATTQKAIDLILTGNYVSGSASVGWNLFHAIAHVADQAVHAFAHIAHDLGPVGTALAASMGLPPEMHLLVPVFMGAHAGNPAAQKHVEKIKAKGGPWLSFVQQMMAHLGGHPDFAAFLTHAQLGAHAQGAHRGAAPHVVGWNLFHAIAHVADQAVHAFAHIAHDLGPVGIALAASMGLPPEAHLLIPALMAAHAGNPAAQKQVAAAHARGGHWPSFLEQMTNHLHLHPHFSAFHAHAQATAHHAAA